MEGSIEYEKYKKLIYQKAHKVAKKYKVEWEEVNGEGNKIFLIALQKYNKDRASFSTYLTYWLGQLNIKYRNQKRKEGKLGLNENDNLDECSVEDRRVFEDTIEKIECWRSLSNNSQIILEYILGREWEKAGEKPHKANLSMILRHFLPLGMRRCDILESWKELTLWWKENYYVY